VVVVVSERRISGARKAVELGADLLLLDDAFQHLAIRRDLDIVLLDRADPLGGGLPPLGRSREPASALSRADMIVLTGSDSPETGAAERLVRRWNAGAPIFHARTRFVGWFDDLGEPPGDCAGLLRRPVAVAAIARPGRFERTLREANVSPVAGFTFRDHHFYSEADRDRIGGAVSELGGTAVVTTEKDQAKLAGRMKVPVLAARIEPDLLEPGFFEKAGEILARRGRVA
jgi:tetraacyldisaccharide 4'-kinase